MFKRLSMSKEAEAESHQTQGTTGKDRYKAYHAKALKMARRGLNMAMHHTRQLNSPDDVDELIAGAIEFVHYAKPYSTEPSKAELRYYEENAKEEFVYKTTCVNRHQQRLVYAAISAQVQFEYPDKEQIEKLTFEFFVRLILANEAKKYTANFAGLDEEQSINPDRWAEFMLAEAKKLISKDVKDTFFVNKADYVIMDVEVDSFDILRITIIDLDGNVLFDNLVGYRDRDVHAETKIHGITWQMLENAPTYDELFLNISAVTRRKKVIGILIDSDEKSFDYATSERPAFKAKEWIDLYDMAKVYLDEDDFEERIEYATGRGGTRNTLDDCLMTLDMLKRMAEGK